MPRTTTFFQDLLKQPNKKRQISEIEIPFLQIDQKNDYQNKYSTQITNINDWTMTSKQQKQTLFQRFCKILSKYIPIIRPNSLILFIWNIINILLIFYNFILIPILILIASQDEKSKQDIEVIRSMFIASIVVIIIDMILVRPRISYYRKQILVLEYEQLLPRYFKLQFILDLVAVVALIVNFTEIFECPIQIRLLFYLKYYTLRQLTQQVEKKLLFSPYLLAFFKFMRMVSIIYFVTSLAACIYFQIDFSYYSEQGFFYQNGYLWLTGSSTVDYMNLIDIYRWPVWYEYALYWAVQTSSGVGYGNMTPRNSMQVFFCNIVMLTTIIIFVFFAGTILDIISQLQYTNLQRQLKLSELNNFQSLNQIQQGSNDKINLYVESLLRNEQDQVQKQLTATLPQKCKTDFLIAYKRQVFDNLQIISVLTWENQAWTPFYRQVIHSLKLAYSSTGEFILPKDRTSNFRLCFIVRGKISVLNQITDFEKDYKDWQYLGQKQFFFGGVIVNTTISRRFTKYHYFQKQSFFSILKKYQNLYQKCREMIDNVQIHKKQTSAFDIRCENCDQFHLISACPINSFWRNRLAKVKLFDQQKSHQRQTYHRRCLRSAKNRFRLLEDSTSLDQVCNTQNYFAYHNI